MKAARCDAGCERSSEWSSYGLGVVGVALSTAVEGLMFPYFALANLIMAYLMGVVLVAHSLWTRAVGRRISPECRRVRLFLSLRIYPLPCRTSVSPTFAIMLVVALRSVTGRPYQATG